MADGTVQEVEVPYEIPDSWEWVRLNEICSLNYFQTIAGEKIPNNSWVLDMEDIEKETGKLIRKTYKTEKSIYKSNKIYFSPNTILFAKLRPNLKKVIVSHEEGYATTELIPIKLFGNIKAEFIKYCMVSPFYFFNIAKSVYGVKMPRVNLNFLNSTLLPLPPLTEQKRIIAQIERALEKVEVYTESYNKLQELDRAFPDKLKKSILQYAMQGKLVAQDSNDEPVEVLLEKIRAEKQKLYEEGKLKKKDLAEIVIEKGDDNSPYQDVPYDIPESWEWVRLNNILDVRDGTHNTPKYVNDGVPLLTSKNLVNGKIVKEPSKLISIEDSLEINKRSKVDKNDILLAMIGTVGNPVLVPKLDYEFSVKNVAILKHITELNMKFTYYFIQYHSIELKKISSGAVQNFVSLKTLRQILFPLPPLAEQKRIVSKISKIFSMIETLV
ncbi:restriction endonuclease subunit S [Streptococcus suis]|uniref:restriction endonuclease subunit S n=1 Tax=Streptococcus suis TaxID=1307 RepID=UPI003F085D93